MKTQNKFRFRYSNGKQSIMQSFTLTEIMNGQLFEVISDNPMYKNWKMDDSDGPQLSTMSNETQIQHFNH